MANEAEDLTLVTHEQLPDTEQSIEHHDDEQGSELSGPNGQVPSVQVGDPVDTDNVAVDVPVPGSQDTESVSRTAPVYYLAKGGPKLKEETVVITANGRSVIVTPECDDPDSQQKPLREKDLKFLRTFSIVAIVMFLPTGIAALVFAIRAARRFKEGAERGDMAPAKKQCKYCEKLIVISLVLGLLMYVFIFAIVEKSYSHHHDHLAYQHGYGAT